MYIRSLLSLILAAVGCKQVTPISDTKDIATASSAKTGMFIPDEESEVGENSSSQMTTEQLAKALNVKQEVLTTGSLHVVPTYEGEQLLVLRQNSSRPMPIGGVDSKGNKFYLNTHLVMIKAEHSYGVSGTIFFKLPKADAPMQGTVSADGNDSNIYHTVDVVNDAGTHETYMVSHLNLLKTDSGSSLIRIGNDIVESKSGRTVLQFRKLGHQVWRVYGTFEDSHFKHGSVLWSPDLLRFISIKEPGAKPVVWKKQDDNSMDIDPSGDVGKIPAIVEKLLDEKISGKDLKLVPLTGPKVATSAWRATSLEERLVGNKATKSLSLVASKPTVVTSDEDFDSFFELDPPEGFSLGNQQFATFKPGEVYMPGQYVDLGNGIRGRVVAPTNTTTQEGYLWNTNTRTTLVESSPGLIREVTSVNGYAPEIRGLNTAEIQKRVAANQAQIDSPDRQRQLQETQAKLRAAQESAQRLKNTADQVGDKYYTPQGFVGNVVVPVATAGVAGAGSSAISNGMQKGISAGATEAQRLAAEQAARMTGNLAGSAIDAVGSTAGVMIADPRDVGTIAGSGATGGAGIATANLPGGTAGGSAIAAGGVLVGAGVNAARGQPVDYTNTGIDAAGAALGAAANAALPGSGVAVGVVADGAKLGTNYVQMKGANIDASKAVAGYVAPSVQNQMYNQALGNMTQVP